MNISDWIIDPFSYTETENSTKLQELIELTINEELKFKFKKGYQKFWIQKQIPTLYPEL